MPTGTGATEREMNCYIFMVSPVLAGNTVIYMVCVCAVSGCSLMNSSTVIVSPM